MVVERRHTCDPTNSCRARTRFCARDRTNETVREMFRPSYLIAFVDIVPTDSKAKPISLFDRPRRTSSAYFTRQAILQFEKFRFLNARRPTDQSSRRNRVRFD